MSNSRYGRYTGGPDPLAPPVDLREALAEVGEQVMAGSSPRRALSELMRRGLRGRKGLDDLAAQANRRRREILAENNLGGTLKAVKDLLDEAVLEERKELARALDDEARFQEMELMALDGSPAKAAAQLKNYRWRSQKAQEAYQKIGQLLGQEMLDQYFDGMKEQLQNADDPAVRDHVRRMLADLNALLDKHGRGQDVADEFAAFMAEHGALFPESPQNVEELIDLMAKRAAAARRFRNSLSPEQRAELDALARQAFGTPELDDALSQLGSHLENARPGEDWHGSEQFDGEAPFGLGEGARAMADIAELEQLANALSQGYEGARVDDIDPDALARQLGDEAAADLRALSELEQELLDQGFLDRSPDGQWRLSPKAMRQLGQAAFRDVIGELGASQGARETRRAGAAGEPTGQSRPWEFGDLEPWDIPKTVTNAVLRTVGEANAGDRRLGGRVRLHVDDVEVQETEARQQAAVALLVDTSFSMVVEDRWLPMKRTALALNHLVSTRFRSDALQIVGFGRSAQVLTAAELTALDGVYQQGTNLHHALLLALKHLRRHPNAQPVVLIVTDGEPTAHLDESDGESVFHYPTSRETLRLTLAAFDQVAKTGAQSTIVRLGDDPGLAHFLDQVARRVGGRVVATDTDGLGAAVVSDYLRAKRKR
ncbi:MAG: vWA domain-containing protein [Segniliparus sp.]|uniref:vWA domain-containing protein n=1 Tax=Segniliparus sp. TaxID=2804064 RepID=UPI003F34E5F0